MKVNFIASVMAILFALMFLMGQEAIPKWFVFEHAGPRLAVAGVAFTVFCYQVGWWPSDTQGKGLN